MIQFEEVHVAFFYALAAQRLDLSYFRFNQRDDLLTFVYRTGIRKPPSELHVYRVIHFVWNLGFYSLVYWLLNSTIIINYFVNLNKVSLLWNLIKYFLLIIHILTVIILLLKLNSFKNEYLITLHIFEIKNQARQYLYCTMYSIVGCL